MAYQNIRQCTYESLAHNNDRFRDTYQGKHLKDKNQAMVLFKGLIKQGLEYSKNAEWSF